VELRFRTPDAPARPTVIATPITRPPLTVADNRYVGEPVAPAQPFQNLTQFDRLVAQYSNIPFSEALDLATTSREPREEAPEETPAPPPRPRATLGQSRRRGINSPQPPRATNALPEAQPENPPAPPPDKPPDQLPVEAAAEPAHSCPDLHDANTLDDLAGRLYRHVRTRLRTELLVDRERSGLLADPI
jgi:hypothetical protein